MDGRNKNKVGVDSYPSFLIINNSEFNTIQHLWLLIFSGKSELFQILVFTWDSNGERKFWKIFPPIFFSSKLGQRECISVIEYNSIIYDSPLSLLHRFQSLSLVKIRSRLYTRIFSVYFLHISTALDIFQCLDAILWRLDRSQFFTIIKFVPILKEFVFRNREAFSTLSPKVDFTKYLKSQS